MFRICALGLMVALGASTALRAETVELTPMKDNTLFSTTTTSNGAGDAVFSGRTGNPGGATVQRALLAFDVAGNIPEGSTITSATLTLKLMMSGPAGPQIHDLHRVLKDWGEGTSSAFGGQGGVASPGDATWLSTFLGAGLWDNPGGDFNPMPSATLLVELVETHTWGPSPQLTADVQDMLDNPGGNFGWLMQGNEDDLFTAKKFGSKDNASPGMRPVLTVEFNPPCPADLNKDGQVNAEDLAILLGSWGPCQ